MSPRLAGTGLALVIMGCAAPKQPGLLRLLPAGLEEKPLVEGKVSRMGFEAPAGAATTIQVRLPRKARTLRVAFCLPSPGTTSVVFRGDLVIADGDTMTLFRETITANQWHEAVASVRAYGGERVTLILTSVPSGGVQDGEPVYWSTPTVTTESPSGPRVILISIDSLRADHVGCYGYARQTTPHIDSLATNAVVFTDCIAQSSWTLPSHASLLTSLFVKTHGACGPNEGVSAKALVIAEELRRHGYATAAFVTAPFLLPQYGMNQGFDVYDARCSSVRHIDSHHDVTNPCLHRRAVEWLDTWHEAPFFLFLHYWDVHYDYVPPAPYDTLFDPGYDGDISGRDFARNTRIRAGMPQRDLEHVIALYDGEIACTDTYVGELFRMVAELGIADETLVVVTSDHGDEFLEHGATGHGHTLYQELIRVPLIWADPSSVDGALRVDDVVQSVDVAPSILEYLGIPRPDALEGRSFVPRLRGGQPEARTAFSETRSGGFLKAVVGTRTKIIRTMLNEQTKAYDLLSDPGELRPVRPESLPGAPALGLALDRFLEEGKVAIEIRIAGVAEFGGRYHVRMLLTDPPLAVRAHGLEPADSLETIDLPPEVCLTAECTDGDVDGATVVVPSAATILKVVPRREGALLSPREMRLGTDCVPEAVPIELAAGDSRLRVPPTNIPSALAGASPVQLWKIDARALATRVELDEETSARLRALGYLQ
jgi:arylsulfatase A-like enzyme